MASGCAREVRERRNMRRSRFGCRNCKLRKLKCDESKPQCRRCRWFRVLCNFMPNIPNLQPVTDDSLIKGSSSAISRTADDFTVSNIELFVLPLNKLLLTYGSQHPFLVHASLGVALVYGCPLNSSLGSSRNLEECYHRSRSTTLFNKWLREPIEAKDKDPIWGTAAALLLFCVMAGTYAQMHLPLPERGIEGVSRALATVCHLDDSSTAINNPCFNAAHAISQIQSLPDSQITKDTSLFKRSSQEAPLLTDGVS
ncbi:hypothetical protein F5Y19DRAFT_463407 [Xylariaceae sp. FL1651]|nr:hypothetical protein F5Y19DRAFT_463407 [Xylariaceae sp. FL1651]